MAGTILRQEKAEEVRDRAHQAWFTSRAYQKLVGVDLYTASRDIKDLIRRRMVRLTRPGGRVYEIVLEPQKAPREKPPELVAIEPILHEKGYVKNEDVRRVLGVPIWRAKEILKRLVAMGWIKPQGQKRGRRYVQNY